MDTLKRYFELSDYAGKDAAAFAELLDLFADNAEIEANNNSTYKGKDAIKQFFVGFFKASIELKHIFTINEENNKVTIKWGVVGKRANQDIFTLTGTDYATLDDNEKITHLKVVGNN